MSLQDESFPDDLLLEDFDISGNSSGGQRFQLPIYKRQQIEFQLEQQLQKQLKEKQQQQQQQQKQRKFETKAEITATAAAAASNTTIATTTTTKTTTTTTTTTTTNTSTSSSEQQNLSTESSNGRPLSSLSGKTIASEPAGLIVSKKLPSNFNEDTKSVSCQDIQNIHSEYTKRRYKHVESKVGQYIANMKAQDEKRRSKSNFQRHRSMPETHKLFNNNSNNNTNEEVSIAVGVTAKMPGLLRFSTSELHKMNESLTSELAAVDSCGNIIGLGVTSSSSSSSSLSNNVTSANNDNNNNNETDVTDKNFIDKMLLTKLANEKERIQSYSDYLQTKLDEKIGENMRLQRNVDFMRFELSNCKDKLKKQESARQLKLGSLNSLNGISNNYPINQFHQLFSESSVSATASTICISSTKATQTDDQLFLPIEKAATNTAAAGVICDTYFTPALTSLPTTFNGNVMRNKHLYQNVAVHDFGMDVVTNSTINRQMIKNTAAVQPISLNFSHITEQDIIAAYDARQQQAHLNNEQPVLRQRTNSNTQILMSTSVAVNMKSTCVADKNNHVNHISSSSYPSSSSDSAINLDVIELSSPKRKRSNNKKMLRSSTPPDDESRDEFLYFDKRTGRCTTLETLNASSSNNEHDDTNDVAAVTTTNNRRGNNNNKKKSTKKRTNGLRKRWLRIFGICLRATDEPIQLTLDTSNISNNGVMQQSYGQVPLLEKSFTNHCRNLR